MDLEFAEDLRDTTPKFEMQNNNAAPLYSCCQNMGVDLDRSMLAAFQTALQVYIKIKYATL